MTEFNRYTAVQAARAIAQGKLKPSQLMEACLARIAAREPEVGAFAHIDPAQALAAAARLDKGPPRGPLHGLPIGVKDVLDTADMPTEYNSPIYKGYQPRADAACVAIARNAGAAVIGKTVTTEFATRFPGRTRNPHNLAHTPGGSSSGSAAAVADFMTPLGFGTQTAGSVVRPAAYCGVVGYKPTFNLINRAGLKIISENLDTIGVLARTVPDAALLVGAMVGRSLADFDAKPERAPRIGLCRSPVWNHAQPETVQLFEQVAGRLAKAGAKIVERELGRDYGGLVEAQAVLSGIDGARALAHERRLYGSMLSEALRTKLDGADRMPLDRYVEMLALAERCRAGLGESFADIDLLLTPSAPGEAPKGIEATGDPIFSSIWTVLYVPCVTVPAGTGPNGLPLGIQIVGPIGADGATLLWAEWVHRALA